MRQGSLQHTATSSATDATAVDWRIINVPKSLFIVRLHGQQISSSELGTAQAVTHIYCIISSFILYIITVFIRRISENSIVMETKVLSYHTALDVLKESEEHDGLTIQELVDSRKHGGLTYNDFLMLPDFIGTLALKRYVYSGPLIG